MLSILKSIYLKGLEGILVNVEVDVAKGLTAWDTVGLPDESVRESKERVKTAVRNSGFELTTKRVVINLAPADVKKGGAYFDLPIALGAILSSETEGAERINTTKLNSTAFVGELSLEGKLNSINGILPICIEARKLGFKRIIIPFENLNEVSIIDGIDIYGAKNLREVFLFLIAEEKYVLPKNDKGRDYWNELILKSKTLSIDFSEVKGQENIKRALEIAAAGNHNILLIGSPGARKNNACKKIANNFAWFNFWRILGNY